MAEERGGGQATLLAIETPMAVLNVKGFPDDLYAVLRERAAGQRRSIAQEVVHLLSEAVSSGATAPQARPADSFVAEPVAAYDPVEVRLTAEARRRLGVRPGERVELSVDPGGRFVATPIAGRDLRQMRGLLKAPRPVSLEAMAEAVRRAGTRG